MYICPVCGYDKLEDPPKDCNICPCCATEFGINDYDWGVEVLRNDWIERGMIFWYEEFDKEKLPKDYNPIKQLENIGIFIEKQCT